MIEVERIIALYQRRKADLAGVNAKRMELRDAYNGELRVVLPDMGRAEPAAVANLLNQGLDQMAMRVSSTLPSIFCPPTSEAKREQVNARKREQALYGWWEANKFATLVPIRARMLSAYAQSPVVLWPDFQRKIPKWIMRNPMETFPAQCLNPGDQTPDDVVFTETMTYAEVDAAYPGMLAGLYRKEKPVSTDRLTVLKYVDAEELVTVLLGHCPDTAVLSNQYLPTDGWGTNSSFHAGARYLELERITNRAGICLAVVPGRLTLDRMLGQFDGMLSMYRQMAHMTALELIAVEKAIFPDTYLEPLNESVTPQFISGPHDGRTGKVNVLKGGRVREQSSSVGFQTNGTIDRLERNSRLAGGIPAEFGGESTSNVRTGKRGDAVLAAAVDFPVGEQQKVLAASFGEENKRAIAVANGWFGREAKSFYVNWKGAKGRVDYVAQDVFTTDDNIVRYSHLGTDTNGMMIMTGQAVGMGVMSKLTAARQMPFIEDAEFEHDQSIKEALEAALLASIQQKVNEGTIAPVDAAWLMDQVGSNKLELAQAVIQLDERVKERQAAQPDPAMDPAMDPMQQAGLATGTPAEAQAIPASIGGANESQDNLAGLLGKLRQPQMTLQSERPAV